MLTKDQTFFNCKIYLTRRYLYKGLFYNHPYRKHSNNVEGNPQFIIKRILFVVL